MSSKFCAPIAAQKPPALCKKPHDPPLPDVPNRILIAHGNYHLYGLPPGWITGSFFLLLSHRPGDPAEVRHGRTHPGANRTLDVLLTYDATTLTATATLTFAETPAPPLVFTATAHQQDINIPSVLRGLHFTPLPPDNILNVSING